mgnify:CR=1 FL=1
MSRTSLGLAVAATLCLGGLTMAAPASAAPMLDPGVTRSSDLATPRAEKARVVCNAWGRCWRTGPRYYGPPRFYGRPHWGPRRYGWGHRRWGHHRGWGHRW